MWNLSQTFSSILWFVITKSVSCCEDDRSNGHLSTGGRPNGAMMASMSQKTENSGHGNDQFSKFPNNKMHTVAFKRKTRVKLCHLTDNKVKSSFKRSQVYLSCRKLSCLHNKPLGVVARVRPAAVSHVNQVCRENLSHVPFRQLLSRSAAMALVEGFLCLPLCIILYV